MFENSFNRPEVAADIYAAIEGALAAGFRTGDIAAAGEAISSTTEMTAAIVARI